jgi:hypothetical protein
MTDQAKLRREIKARFPQFKFNLKTVSFSDLSRGEKVFVQSKEWTPDIFVAVREIAKSNDAIAS